MNEPSSQFARIETEIGKFEGRVSLYAKNLDTGAAYGRGEDTRVTTASTIKTAIMVAVFAEVAAGRAHWDDPRTYSEARKQDGSGILFEFHDGLALTLRDCVNLMMVISDNTATNLVLGQIPTDTVNAHLDALGLTDIRSLRHVGGGGEGRAYHAPENAGFGIGVATPCAMVALLEKLESGQVVSPEASKEMIALLKREQRRLGIGRDLEGVEIASKAGALDLLRSDIGILYTKRGRIAMAITCDQMPRALWTADNPGYLMLSRLSNVLVDGLGQTPPGE